MSETRNPCPKCNGRGSISRAPHNTVVCDVCGGGGVVPGPHVVNPRQERLDRAAIAIYVGLRWSIHDTSVAMEQQAVTAVERARILLAEIDQTLERERRP